MKKHILLVLACLALGGGMVSAQAKPIKPKRDEVVFIAKLRVKPSVPESFFAAYASSTKNPTTVYACMTGFGAFMGVFPRSIGAPNELGYFSMVAGKSRVFYFESLDYRLFDESYLTLSVPIEKYLTVPADVNYVYLGTFEFEYSDEYFTPVSLKRVDEFDSVLETLTAAYGSGVKLIRATYRDTAE